MDFESERRLEIVQLSTKESLCSSTSQLQQKAMKVAITLLCCFFISLLVSPTATIRALRVKHSAESGRSHQYPLLLNRVTDSTEDMPTECRKNLPEYCPSVRPANSGHNYTNTLLHRSISPWYWVRIHNDSYCPHGLIQACCACNHCIDPTSRANYTDLYSEEITVPIKVTDRTTNHKITINIAVGCTCVRHGRNSK